MQLTSRLFTYYRLMRFDKPIGIALVLWPTLVALWLAGHGQPRASLVCIFTLGCIVMRAAGCVINDFADRNFDGHVQRTRERPLAQGDVSVAETLGLFTLLLSMAFGLALLLNRLAFLLAFVGAAVAIIYPFLKRYVRAPQAGLGIAFAWGIPMAFAASQNQLPLSCWLLFIATFAWIIVYDTEYAMVDREDDCKIGIYSTALWFGDYDRAILAVLQAFVLVMLMLVGWAQSLTLYYYVGLLIVALLFVYQQWLIRAREPQYCFQAFLHNHWVGVSLLIAVIVGQLPA